MHGSSLVGCDAFLPGKHCGTDAAIARRESNGWRDNPMFGAGFSTDVAAFHALAALDAYQDAIERLMANAKDPEPFLEASEQIDSLRLYCAELPGMGVAWVTVLISHVELMQGLWQGGSRAEVMQEHLDALNYIRRHCTRLLKDGAAS